MAKIPDLPITDERAAFQAALAEYKGDFKRVERPIMGRIKPNFSAFPQNFRDPKGMVMPDYSPEERKEMSLDNIGQGYPQNHIFQIAIIENPPITMDPGDQKPPRMVLKPTPYLAPSLEIAFIMAAKDIAADADLQRCSVRVAHG